MSLAIWIIHWTANLVILAVCLHQILLFPLLTGRFLYRTHGRHRSVYLLGSVLVAASAILTASSVWSGKDLPFRLFLLACAATALLVQALRGEGMTSHGLLFSNIAIPSHRIRSWKLKYWNEAEVMLVVAFHGRNWGQTGHSVLIPMEDVPGISRVMEEKYGKVSDELKQP